MNPTNPIEAPKSPIIPNSYTHASSRDARALSCSTDGQRGLTESEIGFGFGVFDFWICGCRVLVFRVRRYSIGHSAEHFGAYGFGALGFRM